jgi:hypothetical protein
MEGINKTIKVFYRLNHDGKIKSLLLGGNGEAEQYFEAPLTEELHV